MIFATRDNGTRDGELMLVSRDRKRWLSASAVCSSLQAALDEWDANTDELGGLFNRVNEGEGEPVDYGSVRAPLPRAYEWVDGSAFINHIVLVRKARNAEPPETLKTSPLVYQGGSGILLGARDEIRLADEGWGCDFESEVCVVLSDTPQGVKASDASKHIRLVMLANDVSLRNLIPEELKKGFGFFNSKPATAFSPFALTPDELGSDWQNGRLHLDMKTQLNGEQFGDPNAGPEMFFSFYEIMEHIAKTRAFTAGTILGSGTISNEDRSRGSSCLVERRMIEKIDDGEFKTPFLKRGDVVKIEMFDKAGTNLFGTIEQKVVPF